MDRIELWLAKAKEGTVKGRQVVITQMLSQYRSR
jgi:hypothetical protein